MNNERKGNWMQTYTGGRFYPLDPRPDEIHIEDIAHHLSQINRFTGATAEPYSVAQHSVHVCDLLPDDLKLWGLLHDASEAYLSDIARPLKHSPVMLGYVTAEKIVMMAIAKRFQLQWPMPQAVKVADDMLLVAEARELMAPLDPEWMDSLAGIECDLTIAPWSHKTARREFLQRFHSLI